MAGVSRSRKELDLRVLDEDLAVLPLSPEAALGSDGDFSKKARILRMLDLRTSPEDLGVTEKENDFQHRHSKRETLLN